MHLRLPFTGTSVGSGSRRDQAPIYALNTVVVDAEQLRKLHIHIGHGEKRTTIDMLRKAGREYGENALDLMLQKCWRRNLRPSISNSIVSSHLPTCLGYAMFLDIVYLREGAAHRFPF